MAASAQLAIPTGATATKITATGTFADVTQGNTLALTNTGTVILYIGGSDVTTSNGFRLAVNASIVLDVAEDLYGVVSGGTAGAVDVLRVK